MSVSDFYEIAERHGFDLTKFDNHFANGIHSHEFKALLENTEPQINAAFKAIAKSKPQYLPKRPGSWIERILGEIATAQPSTEPLTKKEAELQAAEEYLFS